MLLSKLIKIIKNIQYKCTVSVQTRVHHCIIFRLFSLVPALPNSTVNRVINSYIYIRHHSVIVNSDGENRPRPRHRTEINKQH